MMKGLYARFRSASPLVKVLMLVSLTSTAVLVHRLWYSPRSRRVQYARAQAWADTIYEQELQAQQQEPDEPHQIGNLRYD